MFRSFFKAHAKFSYGSIAVVAIGCILIFQNCGRIVLSDKVDSHQGLSAFTAYDIEANDIIDIMTASAIKDSNEFNETVDLSAETMTCGNKAGSTKIECVFKKLDLEYSSSVAKATNVKNYLSMIGIPVNCPTCNDTVSYTVKNINCTKDPNFPHGATCTFTK